MRVTLVSSAVLVLLAGCSSSYGGIAPDATAVQVASELPPPDMVNLTAEQRIYRIGPFDSIRIEVFGAQELNREVVVDASGTVAMPLIGQVTAAGLTSAEFGNLIADRLRGRYLRDPQVTVSVTEVRSQRVTIDGSVEQPGVYPVLGRMTLQRAIATAQGTSEFADLDKVVIFRTVNQQQMAALFSLKDIREGRLSDPEIFGNDVVVVGESGSRRLFRDIMQSIPALGVFTPLAR